MENDIMGNNSTEKDSFKKNWKQSMRDYLIFPIIICIISVLATKVISTENEQKAIVETLSNKLDYIEATDKIEEAIDEISKKDKELKEYERKSEEDTNGYKKTISDLENQLEAANSKVTFSSPTAKKNGEALQKNENAVLSFENKKYISEDLLKEAFQDQEFVFANDEINFNLTIEAIQSYADKSGRHIDLLSLKDQVTHDNYITISGLTDTSGKSFAKAVYSSAQGDVYIEYDLGKKYKWFQCEFFVPDEAKKIDDTDDVWKTSSVTITDQDGTIIAQFSGVNRRKENYVTDLIQISNAEFIRINFIDAYSYNDYTPTIAVGNPILISE